MAEEKTYSSVYSKSVYQSSSKMRFMLLLGILILGCCAQSETGKCMAQIYSDNHQ